MFIKNSRFKPYLIAIITGLTLSLIGLVFYLFYSGLVKPGNIAADSKSYLSSIKFPKAYIVQSGSMEPAIKTGSVVVSYPSPIYAIGDVITFAKSEGSKQFITHRIEARNFPDGIDKDPVYQTSGDANEDFDAGHVKPTQIVGKVVITLPYLGYVANFAKQPYGFLLLVIVPATIVIYEELKSLFVELLKQIKEFRAKRIKKGEINEVKKDRKLSFTKLAVAVPVLGAAFVIVALSAGFFHDMEKNIGNILGAAQSFGEKTANLYNSSGYTCPGGAADNLDTPLGLVVLKIVEPDLKGSVKLNGAAPNSSYDVWVNQDSGSCPLSAPSFPAAISTDASGNSTVYSFSITKTTGATSFWISAVGGGQVLRSTAVTLP